MRISRSKVALAALAAALAIPAVGQDKPESILPPGFGDPTPPPSAPRPRAVQPVRPEAAATPVVPRPAAPVLAPTLPDAPDAAPSPLDAPTPTATPPAATDFAAFVRADMPAYARRSLDRVGVAGPAQGAMGTDAFGQADGRYLETLMRRLNPPVASRWVSIALRRALLARVDTPRGVNGADFAAERAWLLVRMGESVGARAMVQAVDTEDYTPKMFVATMQAALATGDPAALCPAVEAGANLGAERGWILARAMCAGLSGMPAKVKPLIDQARRSRLAGGVDLLLAQKVAGAGQSGRQAVTIEWDDVSQLTSWRYGLAMASGVEIPDTLLATGTPAVDGWRALAPTLAPNVRAAAAELAAARGILSSAALIDLYSAIDAGDDQSIAEAGIARDLRAAYDANDVAGRADALKRLWDEPKTAEGRYARLVLTAGAAARLPQTLEKPDVDRIVASILSAGLDPRAQRWRDKASRGSDAWAMLTLADPAEPVASYDEVSAYAGANDSDGLKRRMLFAGLAGLGRMSASEVERGARTLGVRVGHEDSWTRAIGKAALDHEPGTVALLSAVGMQTRSWRGVSPEALYHIVLALRAVGLPGEAKMVAVEAMSRL
ncbi:hypothetical protein [Sphingomonas sp. PAMC 26605]|uniref:hypothetical protein n=1 Tax=Sphingomonas sp. PAMC 26605 TaxID=1112214 RepID=UPI00026CB153|nr:hypothetical protein [Sphingomonas sp. PAMC 26605]